MKDARGGQLRKMSHTDKSTRKELRNSKTQRPLKRYSCAHVCGVTGVRWGEEEERGAVASALTRLKLGGKGGRGVIRPKPHGLIRSRTVDLGEGEDEQGLVSLPDLGHRRRRDR